MLPKCPATELHPRSSLFDICLAMYPKLTSKWKLSCFSFPKCWYVYTTMLNYIPCFDHILGTCMFLLLHLPTIPKSKPFNGCILSFLEQKATGYLQDSCCMWPRPQRHGWNVREAFTQHLLCARCCPKSCIHIRQRSFTTVHWCGGGYSLTQSSGRLSKLRSGLTSVRLRSSLRPDP